MPSHRAARQTARRFSLILAGSIAALLGGHAAQAATYYWDTSSGDGFGSQTGGWDGVNAFWNSDSTGAAAGPSTALPTSADDLNLSAGSAGFLTITGTGTGSSLTLSNNVSTLITGGTLALGGSGLMSGLFVTSADTAPTVIASALTLNGTAVTLQNAGTGLLTLSGGISGAQNLILNNNSTTAGGITVSGLSLNSAGTITNSGTGSGSVLISSLIGANVLGITQNSATSALTLANTANTFAGGLTIEANSALVTAATIGGTNTTGLGTGAVSIGAGSTLNLLSGATNNTVTAIGNTFTGTGVLKLTFTGTTATNTTLTGVNGFNGIVELANNGLQGDKLSGAINAPGMTVQINSGSQLYTSVAQTIGNITVLGSGNSENRGAFRLQNSTLTVTGSVSLLGDTIIGPENGALAGNITSGAAGTQTLTLGTSNSTGNGTFSGIIGGGTGTIGLTKIAAGTATLSGANTYTGTTTVNAGTLLLTGSLASTSPLAMGGGTFTYTSATAGATQAVNGLTVNAGGSTLNNTLSGTTLALGGIARGTGNGAVSFGTTTGPITTTAINVSGIIAPWASFGTGANTKYAVGSAAGAATTITGLTGTAAATGANLGNSATANYELAAGGGTVPATVSAHTIRYAGAAGTTAPGATGFTVNGLMNAGTGLWTIGTSNVTIGANRELVVNLANNSITISSAIVDNAGGASALTVMGASANTLTLSKANTFTGVTTVNGGNLTLGIAGAIKNAATNTITVNNGGKLTFGVTDIWGTSASGVPATPLVINAGGTVTNTGTFFDTLGPVTLNGGTLTSVGGNSATFPSFALRGTVTVGGTSPSTLSSSGTNGQFSLGAGSVTSTTFNVADVAPGNDLIVSAILQNGANASNVAQTSSLTKTGAGTMVLSGVNTYSGTTVISTGTLTLSGARTVAAGTITVGNTVNSTATLNVSAGTFTTNIQVGTGANNTAIGVVNQSGGTLTMGGNQLLIGNGSATGTYNLSGGTLAPVAGSLGVTIGVNTGSVGTFNLSGSGVLSMPATSTLQITRSDTNLATGVTGTFNQTGGTATVGILQMGGSSAAPASNFGQNATLNLTGGTFAATTFNQLSGGDTSTSTINIGGTAVVTLPAFPTARGTDSTATLNFNGGTLKPAASSTAYLGGLTNAFIKGAGATIDTNNFNIVVSQPLLSDATSLGGGLTKIGSGTLGLSGVNAYTGGTVVSAGALSYLNLAAKPVSGITAVGASGTLGLGVKVGDAAYYSSADVDELFAGNLVGNLANITMNATSGVGIDTTAGDFTYATNQSAARSLSKLGLNTLTLTGTNTYSGTTTVSGGTLVIPKPISLPGQTTPGQIIVASGATLALNVGGLNEFAVTDVANVLANGTFTSNTARLALDTTNASGGFNYTSNITAAIGLTKLGSNTLTLSGANTYTGTTVVTEGTLVAAGGSTGAGNLLVGTTAANAILNVPVGGTMTGGQLIVGSGNGGAGAVNVSGGTLTLSTPETIDTASFGGGEGGYGAFTLSSGTFTQSRFMFGGTGGVSATGVGLVSGGTVNSNGWMILSRGATSTGVLTITGGTINHSGANNVIAIGLSGSGRAELNVAGGLIDNTSRNVAFSGGTTGTFHWTGTGLLNLNAGTLLTNSIAYDSGSPNANSYLNFSGGTLKASAASTSFLNAFTPSGTGLNRVYVRGAFGSFAGGATIDTNGFDTTVSANLLAPSGNGVASLVIDNAGSGYIGAPVVKILDNGLPSTATGYAVVGIDPTDTATFGKVTSVVITNPGEITGTATVELTGGGGSGAAVSVGSLAANTSGGLIKSGTGILTLSGASTYTGGTLLAAGIVQADNSSALGTGTVTFLGTASRLSLSTGVNISNPIIVGSNGGTSSRGLFEASSGTATLSGPITLNSGTPAGGLFASVTGATLRVDSVITSSFYPVTARAGTTVFSGGGTGYTSMLATGTVSIGANNGVATTAVLDVGTSGTTTFDLKGFNQELAGLTRSVANSATMTSTSGTPILTLNTSGANAYTYSGAITGSLGVTKSGTGTQTLSGTDKSYTGATLVNAGTLVISGTLSGSTISVNDGGTLGGNGTVGTVNVANGGIVAPGVGIGTLNTGAFSLASTSVLKFELGLPDLVGSTDNDLLNVGALTLDGTLQVTQLAGFGQGTYRLFNYSGALQNNDLELEAAFLNANPGSYIDLTVANTVNLVVVPEPSAFLSILGGLAMLLGLRRRRA